MCLGCFYEYTDAPVINDRVTTTASLIRTHGDDARYSGLLHAIVDDMNVDDWLFSLDDDENESNAWKREAYATVTDWERQIFNDLAALTEAERATAVALAWGYDLNMEENQ